MARRVDQVQVVDDAVFGLVGKRCRLRLDRDAALFFQIHRIEHLLAHFAIGQPSTTMDEPIRERRFAVVDVRDDGKIAYVLHSKKGKGHRAKADRSSRGLFVANR